MKHVAFHKLSLVIAIFIISLAARSQNVGIGTSSPGAKLDVSSSSDGILIPRVALTATSSATPLSSPVTSTMVYNTATAGSGLTAVSPGFYYWDGGQWVRLIDFTGVGGTPTVSNSSSANTLTTTVNSVTSAGAPIINTNTLSQNGSNQLISTVNGQASTPINVAVAGDVTGNLGSSTVAGIQGTGVAISSLTANNLLQYNGTNWVNVSPASVLGSATTNTITNPTNTITTTVNGVAASTAAVNTVSNTSATNTLSTTVNGVAGSGVNIINSNSKTWTQGGGMTDAVNGVSANVTPASGTIANVIGYDGTGVPVYQTISGVLSNTTNTLANPTNTITSTVNGVAATTSAVNTVANSSSANTLSTTVNGVAGSSVNIINTNTLTQNGSNQLNSTVNGVAAGPTTLSIAGDVTGNLGASTVVKLQGQPVSATTPTATQVLQYNSGSWTPTTPGASLFTAGTGLSWSSSTLNSVWTVSGSNIYNNNAANVGIGQSSPSATLDVNGNIQISNSTIPMGLMTELSGSANPLLNMDVNFRESNKNTTYRGAGFRIDTRTGQPVFQWITRAAASTTENVQMSMTETGVVNVANLAGTSTRPVYADASGNLHVASSLGYSSSNKATFTYTTSSGTGASGTPSSGATWTIPTGVTQAYVKLWGAGGGGNTSGGSVGGGAGFISGWLTWPSGTTSLTIIVGGGGGLGNPNGAAGSNGGGSSSYQGGGGGGRSCIQVGGTDYVAAGGGGGSINGCYCRGGGAGGGGVGLTGYYATANGQSSGGTQTAVGNSSPGSTVASGHNGGSHPGGSSYSYGGAGGGGWFGGGAGGYNSANGNDGSGSGGSSGGNSTYFTFNWGEAGQMFMVNVQPNGPTYPGGVGDPDYIGGVGVGGNPTGYSANTAGNGYVVIYW